MKIDLYKTKERYLSWKEKVATFNEIGSFNKEILLKYLNDMEIGINVYRGATKGARSFIHLNSLKDRLISLMKKIKDIYGIDTITAINEEQLHLLFAHMRNGTIVKPNGEKYMCVRDYVKIFKAFWHWHQRVSLKKGVEITDITIDLDTKEEKPDWVYLTEEQVKKLADNSKHEYKVLIMFLFDTGIRAPGELMNLRVSDFYNDFKELNIRQEISKTFGRRIKLMLSSSLIKEHIASKGLKGDDHKPILFYNKRVSLTNLDVAQLFLCNADESELANIRVNNARATNGLSLVFTDRTLLSGIFVNNTYRGLFMHRSNHNSLTNFSILSSMNEGLALRRSNFNTISSGVISNNNEPGVTFAVSSNNTLSRSLISGNGEAGLYIDTDSLSNLIYNNFLNNSHNALILDNYPNEWNVLHTSGPNILGGPFIGGNYWANSNGTGFSQICTDKDRNGFCDASYFLLEGNSDNLPLSRFQLQVAKPF